MTGETEAEAALAGDDFVGRAARSLLCLKWAGIFSALHAGWAAIPLLSSPAIRNSGFVSWYLDFNVLPTALGHLRTSKHCNKSIHVL